MTKNELLQIFALANEFKEGDLAVGGTRDDRMREEAREALASLTIGEITRTAFVEDQITEVLHRSLDKEITRELADVTVGGLKQTLLGPNVATWVTRYADGLASEAIAAAAKLMTDDEMGSISRAIFNQLRGPAATIGARDQFGSRIQPNSPGDDEEEILFSILEGLTYGCGDVIIGLNPASDDVDTIVRLEQLLATVVQRLELPTRCCVLSDIAKQHRALAHTRIDVGFQSLAGTSKAVIGMAGFDVDELLDLARDFDGLYFETGQGSAVTNQAAEGVDMLTLESRAYGLARYLRRQTGAWTIVNDVAGFIGPEVFRTGKQLFRACLEDTMMAKLHGITMGLDVCATFHMGIAPAELRELTTSIVERAAPAYLMGVAGNADPMLGYMTTSFRDHPALRRRTKKQISSAMKQRLVALGVMKHSGEALGLAADSLFAVFQKAGGDTRTFESLRQEGARKIGKLAESGFDLGYGTDPDLSTPPKMTSRLEAIYANARRALYATLEDSVIKDACLRHLRVRTKATSREQYLQHPTSGEAIRDEDAARIRALYALKRPAVQIVISDGLNADAVNESLRLLLPNLRGVLDQSRDVGNVDVVVENGRVRAGYQIGLLLDVDLVIHLIGERPGTGINTLSAYLTYGRDARGESMWQDIGHSSTSAVCGINRRGKTVEAAVVEIARLVNRMFEQRCSGVALRSASV